MCSSRRRLGITSAPSWHTYGDGTAPLFCHLPEPQISHVFGLGHRIAPSGEHASPSPPPPVAVVVAGGAVVAVADVAGGCVGSRTPDETPVSQSQVIAKRSLSGASASKAARERSRSKPLQPPQRSVMVRSTDLSPSVGGRG